MLNRNWIAASAVLTALIVMGCLACPAQAESFRFMSINFDGDTTGQAPSVSPSPSPLTAATPMTKVYALGGYGPYTTDMYGDSPPTATDGVISVGNVMGMSKAAIMTSHSGNGEMGALYMDTGFGLTAQTVSLSFDLNILAAPTLATVQPKLLNQTSDTAGIIFGINTYVASPGAWGFRFAAAPTSDTGGVLGIRSADNSRLITFGNYVEGQTYHIDLVGNYTTGTVDAYLDHNLALSDHAFWVAGADNATTSEFFMYLNGQSTFANQVAIDNIEGFNYAVPEPASLLLLAAGGMALATRGKRRSMA